MSRIILKEKGKVTVTEDKHTLKPDEIPDGDILVQIGVRTVSIFYVEGDKKYPMFTYNINEVNKDSYKYIKKYYRGDFMYFGYGNFMCLFNMKTKQTEKDYTYIDTSRTPVGSGVSSGTLMLNKIRSNVNTPNGITKYIAGILPNEYMDIDSGNKIKFTDTIKINNELSGTYHSLFPIFPSTKIYRALVSHSQGYGQGDYETEHIIKLTNDIPPQIEKKIDCGYYSCRLLENYLYIDKNKGKLGFCIGDILIHHIQIGYNKPTEIFYDENLDKIENVIGPVEKISDTLFLSGGCLFKIRQKEEKKTIKCKKCAIHMEEYEVIIFPCKCKDICLQCSRAISECIICKYTIDHILEI